MWRDTRPVLGFRPVGSRGSRTQLKTVKGTRSTPPVVQSESKFPIGLDPLCGLALEAHEFAYAEPREYARAFLFLPRRRHAI